MYQTQYEGLSNGGFLKYIKLYQISSNTLHATPVSTGSLLDSIWGSLHLTPGVTT